MDGPPPDDSGMGECDEDELDVAQYIDDWQLPDAEEQAAAEEAQDAISDLPPASGLAAEWLALFERLGLTGLTQSIAAHCQLVGREQGIWTLHLDPGHSALYNENHRKRLEQAIGTVQEQPVQLLVEVAAPTQETPAVAAARRKAARQRAAEQSIVADPLVQRLQSDFAAHICEGSIRPLDAPVN
ncbi:MAG: DNA polymerase III subunit gamma/tau [Pseudomonadales bacterium]|nr:DNA polymerase III subunit gamma/tau [Pseudomonadales bacterium]